MLGGMCDQMNVAIREARETDLEFVRKYTVETGWGFFSEGERKQLDKEKWTKYILEGFERLSKRETDKIFVAEDEQRSLVGYLWVGEGTNMMTGLKHGYIYDIFVREDCRGKGYGRIFMEKAENYCREKNLSRILLMVSVSNERAARLYDKMGYKAEQTYMAKALN